MTDVPISLLELEAKAFGTAPEGQGETPAPTTPEAPQEVPTETQEDEGLGILGTIGDIGKGVVGGVRNGLQETGETIQWAGESLGNAITGGSDVYWTRDDGFEWLTQEEVLQRDDVPEWQTKDLIGETMVLPEAPETDTIAGGFASGTAQFLAGFAVAGKAFKGVKAVTKGGVFAKAAAQGAATDFVAFDAHEERFSNFLRDNTPLRDPITEYLAANEDDTILEGKLKNALEGLGLGMAVDGMVRLAKGVKIGRKVKAEKGEQAAAEVMAEAVDEAMENGQLNLFDEISDPNIRMDEAAGPSKVVTKGGKADPDAIDPRTGEKRPLTVTEYNKRKVPERLAPKPPMDTKAFQEAIDYEVGITRGGSVPDPNRTLTGSLFNFDRMDADVSTLEYLNMASEAVPDSLIQDTTTFAKMEKDARAFLSDSIDVSPEVLDAGLANLAKMSPKASGMVLAGKQMVQSLSREIETLAYKIAAEGSDVDRAKMVRLQSRAMELSANIKSITKSSAQTTASGRIHTRDAVTGQELAQADITKQLLDSVDKAGGRDAVDKLAREIVANREAGNGVAGTMRISANRQAKGFWAVTNEMRINGLLSGPKTHVINVISNTMQTVLLPSEKIIGGALGGDRVRMREGAVQYMGIAMALKDSLKAAGIAAKQGRNILDPEASLLETQGVNMNAIRSDSENPLVRGVINSLGTAVRLPSRGLMGGDELFKQINYRADLYARLNTKAMELVDAGQVSSKDASKWIADRMETGFGRDGQATSMDSIDFAREATFTNDLVKGSIPKRLQDASNAHPALKLIFPFVRTPTNLVVASAQRTPIIGLMTKTLQADLKSGDPSRIARAKGKQATGALLWGAGIVAAMEGKITGSGPVDPVLRKRMEDTGWRPYSVKVGDKYVAYDRLDPFAMFFGVAADITDIQGQLGEAEGKQLAVAASAAVINNLASKTWLKGATDFAQFLTNPEMRGEGYLQTMATSFIPYSSALREGRKAVDPIKRDTKGDPYASFWELQSLVNAAKNTIPGFSEELPAKRSWITGEPIMNPKGWGKDMVTPLGEAFASMNPIYEGEFKDDLVLNELARVSGSPSAPARSVMGVDLTPKQYETYSELHGKVRSPTTRRTLYQELEHRFKSPAYDLNRERFGEDADGNLDRRTRIVRKVITAYRELATRELMAIYPDIRQKIGDRNAAKRRNSQSALAGLTDLSAN